MQEGYLHITSGPQKGLRVPLKKGLTIGRKKAQLNIDDPRASNLHAQIEFTEGKWQILDMGSTNGIYFKGKKLANLILEDETAFTIGDTQMKVTFLQAKETTAPIVEEKTKAIKETTKTVAKDPENIDILNEPSEVADEIDLPNIPKYDDQDKLVINSVVDAMETQAEKQTREERKKKDKPKDEVEALRAPDWVKKLIKTIQSVKVKNHKPLEIKPFEQVIELSIFRGLQTGTKWTLGYGPRAVGKKSLDLPIFDSTAPEVCFTVYPAEGGPVYKTEHKGKVLINGEKKSEEILKPGDIIKVGNTEIEVQLLL